MTRHLTRFPRSRIATGLLIVLLCTGAPVPGAVSVDDAAVGTTPPPPIERSIERWSPGERDLLRSLSIEALGPPPISPANPVADDPAAVRLGHRLFFDPSLSVNGEVACASCHRPGYNFRDALPRGRAIGETRRRTMTVVGSAWSPWLYWDGRKDSLWAQALEPLEDLVEHGGTRTAYLRTVAADPDLRSAYEALFGALPELSDEQRFPLVAGPAGHPDARRGWQAMTAGDRIATSTAFANLGRALEAYQRRLVPAAAPFDRYVRAVLDGDAAAAAAAMSPQAQDGLALFIGRAQCTHCHNGALFTNNEFHNTGLFGSDVLPADRGRADGVKALLEDPFNCLAVLGERADGACDELRFVKGAGIELVAAFRTPTLRNVAASGPFMHSGQFATLAEVIDHYDRAPVTLISDELEPLGLTADERTSLEAFLHTLSGPLATPHHLLVPPASVAPDAGNRIHGDRVDVHEAVLRTLPEP